VITWLLIVIAVFAYAISSALPHQRGPIGAAFGPKLVTGHWWLLVTANFIHYSADHLFENLFWLWLFGKRLERILGRWTFAAVFLSSGLVGHIVTFIVVPEIGTCGASASLFGIAGALLCIYSLRAKELSTQQWIKLTLLMVWTCVAIYGGFRDPEVNNYGHIGGLVTGIVLGGILSLQIAQSMRFRTWVFAGVGFATLCGAVWIELHDRYLVHVDAAINALDQKRYDTAAQELHVALAMRPESRLARSLVHEIDEQKSFRNACDSLPVSPKNRDRVKFEPCAEMQCDGKPHTLTAMDGTRILYVGTSVDSGPIAIDGQHEKSTSTEIVMEALDEFGEDTCAVSWQRTSRIRVNAHGSSMGTPSPSLEKTSILSEFDPRLIWMEKQSGISKIAQ
jgi:rhomboid protease GluP